MSAANDIFVPNKIKSTYDKKRILVTRGKAENPKFYT